MAVFQQMSASPTTVNTANSTIAYGMLPNHTVQAADAIRAYIQSYLNTQHETWVSIPPELRPAAWGNKYTRPMCHLVKALYGHPESGGHWEKHLNAAVEEIGGGPIENHPSSFWFPEHEIMLTVYVDDLMLAGPRVNLDKVWTPLRKLVTTEEPESLDRFSGRTHDFTRS